MENSSAVSKKKLPEKADNSYIWKNVDKTHNTECFDGESRDCGSIRIMPSLLDMIETPIPRKYLGGNLSKVNLDPFIGFSDFGLVFKVEADYNLIDSELWSRNPVSEFIPPEEAEKIQDNLIGLCVVNTSVDRCIFKRNSTDDIVYLYDIEDQQVITSMKDEDIEFLDVPDDVLLEYIPDKYLSNLVSKEI